MNELPELSDMYDLLEKMYTHAKDNNLEEVVRLNAQLQVLFKPFYNGNATYASRLYDDCRKSCRLSVLMPGMRETFLKDAIKAFNKIEKPEYINNVLIENNHI
jgi:hypothetical protein